MARRPKQKLCNYLKLALLANGVSEMLCQRCACTGYVPSDAPGSSSYFTPKAARKATKLAMQNPVIAQLDVALTK